MKNLEPVRVRSGEPTRTSDATVQAPLGLWHTGGESASETLELGEIWATLREHRLWLLMSVLLALALTLALTLASRMEFKASGGLYLGDLDERGAPSGASETLDFLGGGRAELGTEVEVIKSETLVGRAISEAGLNVSITPLGATPARYLRWRLSERDPGLIDLAARELRARGAELPEKARAQAYRVKFSSSDQYELSSGGKALAKGRLNEPLLIPGLQITLLRGLERGPAAGRIYDLVVRPLDEVLEHVFDTLSVSSPRTAPGQTVNVVRLEFSNESPSTAQAFLERLMRGYLEQRQLWKTEKASAVETFVSNQLGSMRTSLDEAERRLAEYKKSSGVVVLSDEAKTMIEQIGKFEEQRVAARLQVSALNDIQHVLNSKSSAPVEAYLMGEAEDTVLAGLGASLTKAQEELKKVEHQFTGDAPAVLEERARVDAQREMVKNYVSTRLSRAREQFSAIDHVIGQSNEKLKGVPATELELAQRVRDAEVFSKMYSYLLERKQQASIVKAATISDNRILDLPKVRYHESSPRLGVRLMLGALFGLLVGALSALFRQRAASTFQSLREVQRRFPETPIFSILPKRPKPASGEVTLRRAVTIETLAGRSGSAFREAFRLLRANVYRAGGPALSRVVLVTSFDPGDGKTLTTYGLAATLAAEGNQVLVIDADGHSVPGGPVPRRPGPGLAEVLSGQALFQNVVNMVPVPNSEFFSLGPGDASASAEECFSSMRLAAFLAEARSAYSFILIDAPSMSRASDALLMSAYADLVLVVLRLGNSRRALALEHMSRLVATTESAIVINTPEAASADLHGRTAVWIPVQPPASDKSQAAPVTVLRRGNSRP